MQTGGDESTSCRQHFAKSFSGGGVMPIAIDGWEARLLLLLVLTPLSFHHFR